MNNLISFKLFFLKIPPDEVIHEAKNNAEIK